MIVRGLLILMVLVCFLLFFCIVMFVEKLFVCLELGFLNGW